MKENEHLSEVLAAWRVAPSRDSQFRARVRERLGKPVSVHWIHYLRDHLAPCVMAASLMLGVGAWLGHVQAEREVKKDQEIMTAAYLASLDARYQATLQDKR